MSDTYAELQNDTDALKALVDSTTDPYPDTEANERTLNSITRQAYRILQRLRRLRGKPI